MTIDQLGLYQGALRMLGERKLSSLTEARGPRLLLDDVWAEDPIKACLEDAEWSFATRTALLEADNGVEPDFGYANGFEKPDDWVRTAAISLNEFFDPPLKEFRDEGGFLWLDSPTVYFSWVSDDSGYGRNYAIWPISFQNYVMAYMAKKIHPTVVNATQSIEMLDKQMEKILSKARGKNALTRPVHKQPQGGWVTSRLGSSNGRRSDR